MKYYFLQYQTTHPERHERYTSLKYAKEAFLEVASELARHGQRSLATVHIAPTRYEIGGVSKLLSGAWSTWSCEMHENITFGPWVSVKHLPELTVNEVFRLESEPVLVFDGYRMLVAYAMRDDDSDEVRWISDCSEGWDITHRIKLWAPLPMPPK